MTASHALSQLSYSPIVQKETTFQVSFYKERAQVKNGRLAQIALAGFDKIIIINKLLCLFFERTVCE